MKTDYNDPDRKYRIAITDLVRVMKRLQVFHMFFPITGREMHDFINKMKRGY